MCMIGLASEWPPESCFSFHFLHGLIFILTLGIPQTPANTLPLWNNGCIILGCAFSRAEKRAWGFSCFLTHSREKTILNTQTFVSRHIKNNHKINHKRGIKATSSGSRPQWCRVQIHKRKGWLLSEMVMWNKSSIWKRRENWGERITFT